MELFRRTLAGMLMLVVAVSVGIWVQGRFIDAVRLPTHTRMIGATYTTLSDPFYETINDEIQMQIKSNGDLLLVRDPGQDQERQNQEIEDMLNKGIELLIVNPVDYVGVTPALEKAREKGVPVILIDSKVDDPELVTCTITSNNYGAGLAGRPSSHQPDQERPHRAAVQLGFVLQLGQTFRFLPDPDQKRQRLPDPGAAGLRRRAEPCHARDGAAVGDVPAH